MLILAIETSCDETAAAVIEVRSKKYKGYKSYEVLHNLITSELHTFVLSNVVSSQINIHKKFGGVFPEHASRAHTERIVPVVEQALAAGLQQTADSKNSKKPLAVSCELIADIDVIAVTTGPGLIGSLLIGVNFAKTLAYAKNMPIIPVNHLTGHIYSNWVQEPRPLFPVLILIVSGGHTGLYLMKSHNNIVPLGETLDDAAGEAFDKVAKLLGLGYPGGPAIAAAAEKIRNPKSEIRNKSQIPNIKLPRSMLNSGDYNFSFSGLKTAVLYKAKELNLTCQRPLRRWSFRLALTMEFQQAVIDILVGKTIQAAYEFKTKSICLCGGVSANKELREQMKKAVSGLPWRPSFHVPAIHLSTDNAAMIGIAAAYHLDEKTTWDKISANANLRL